MLCRVNRNRCTSHVAAFLHAKNLCLDKTKNDSGAKSFLKTGWKKLMMMLIVSDKIRSSPSLSSDKLTLHSTSWRYRNRQLTEQRSDRSKSAQHSGHSRALDVTAKRNTKQIESHHLLSWDHLMRKIIWQLMSGEMIGRRIFAFVCFSSLQSNRHNLDRIWPKRDASQTNLTLINDVCHCIQKHLMIETLTRESEKRGWASVNLFPWFDRVRSDKAEERNDFHFSFYHRTVGVPGESMGTQTSFAVFIERSFLFFFLLQV